MQVLYLLGIVHHAPDEAEGPQKWNASIAMNADLSTKRKSMIREA